MLHLVRFNAVSTLDTVGDRSESLQCAMTRRQVVQLRVSERGESLVTALDRVQPGRDFHRSGFGSLCGLLRFLDLIEGI